MAWHTALDASFPGTRWALAVQDGMDGDTVRRICGTWGWLTDSITTIFVGGTMEWKLATMGHWAQFAHERGMDCHVGRIGTVERMMVAERSGADSINSTTWVQRNGSLRRHVAEYRARTVLEDFARRGARTARHGATILNWYSDTSGTANDLQGRPRPTERRTTR